MGDTRDFDSLLEYLRRVPAMGRAFGTGRFENGGWWVKFSLELSHPLAWNVVQEFGHVLNYLSIEERLPTCFMPVSPPPYLNGGPSEYLSWVVECRDPSFKPGTAAKWLESRLPRPVDDVGLWPLGDDA